MSTTKLNPKSIRFIFLRSVKQNINCAVVQHNLLHIWTDLNLYAFSLQLLTL